MDNLSLLVVKSVFWTNNIFPIIYLFKLSVCKLYGSVHKNNVYPTLFSYCAVKENEAIGCPNLKAV